MNIALKWTRPIQPIGGHVLKALRNISISHNYQQQEGTKADGDKITRRPPKTLAFKNVPAGSGRGDNEASKKVDNISRAMAYYIKTKSERDSLMSFKSDEYEIGRRHLANIMGKDPESFTQKDIDEAIEYLLPSGLFNKKARPFFKHPEQYYPKSKIASFGNDGRPLHTLFYTGCPEFYQLIYNITQKIIDLNKLEDSMNLVKEKMKMFNKEDERLNEFSKVDLTGSKWISHADFCKKIDINIDEFNYKKFILLLQKLADHPLSKREEEFINQYKVAFEPPIKLSQIPEPSVDNEGRKYQEIETHKRTSRVIVRLYDQGTGEVRITSPDEGGEFDIKYFDMLTHREQLLFPFKVVDRVNKFDLHVKVLNGGGMSCMAKAVRYAISKALCAFISSDSIEKLRLAGLLTLDSRRRERKKAGQKGARRKFTWLKR